MQYNFRIAIALAWSLFGSIDISRFSIFFYTILFSNHSSFKKMLRGCPKFSKGLNKQEQRSQKLTPRETKSYPKNIRKLPNMQEVQKDLKLVYKHQRNGTKKCQKDFSLRTGNIPVLAHFQ